MHKDVLKRLERLQFKLGEPVKIWHLYRMPDGSEQRRQWKGSDRYEQMHAWKEATGAVFIDLLIHVERRDVY